jgi:hypothetical protein
LSSELVSNVTRALTTLLTSLQSNMAIGQDAQTISTTYIRTSSSVIYNSNSTGVLIALRRLCIVNSFYNRPNIFSSTNFGRIIFKCRSVNRNNKYK